MTGRDDAPVPEIAYAEAVRALSVKEIEALIEPVYEMETMSEVLKNWLPWRKKKRKNG